MFRRARGGFNSFGDIFIALASPAWKKRHESSIIFVAPNSEARIGSKAEANGGSVEGGSVARSWRSEKVPPSARELAENTAQARRGRAIRRLCEIPSKIGGQVKRDPPRCERGLIWARVVPSRHNEGGGEGEGENTGSPGGLSRAARNSSSGRSINRGPVLLYVLLTCCSRAPSCERRGPE